MVYHVQFAQLQRLWYNVSSEKNCQRVCYYCSQKRANFCSDYSADSVCCSILKDSDTIPRFPKLNGETLFGRNIFLRMSVENLKTAKPKVGYYSAKCTRSFLFDELLAARLSQFPNNTSLSELLPEIHYVSITSL